MANLVTKFSYLKPGARQSRGGYVKYIATRDGVEKLDDTQRLAPATVKQMQFIENCCRIFLTARKCWNTRTMPPSRP